MFAMRWRILLVVLGILLIPGRLVSSQEDDPGITILSPSDEEVIFGIYPLAAEVNQAGVTGYSISFTYAHDDRRTWFPLTTGSELVDGRIEYEWDTNQVTDGNYDLRIQVFFEGEPLLSQSVRTIRVRNYTQIETLTPTQTPSPTVGTVEPQATIQPTATPTETATPTLTFTPWRTPTPLPPNPVEITDTEFRNNFGLGAAITLGSLTLIGIYNWLRRRIKE